MRDAGSKNTFWTRRSLLAYTCHALQEGGIEDARRNAEWMLEEALGITRTALFAEPGATVAPDQAQRVQYMTSRRLRHEPLQYVLGHVSFYGLDLIVTPAVLIPRPETEEVVEHALSLLAGVSAPRVLDVGTGSGCITLAVRAVRPDAVVHACDVSPEALDVASANAASLNLDVSLFHADVLESRFPVHAPGDLDLLISNPPYIPDGEAGTLEPEVFAHEPHLALFSGQDPLLFYRAITRHAASLLKSGGFLVFEVHADYGDQVRNLVQDAGFQDARLLPDLSGRPRIVSGRR